MKLTIPSLRDFDLYATVEVVDGYVRARLFRRHVLLASRRYDALLHLVTSRICDDLAAGSTTLSETIDAP